MKPKITIIILSYNNANVIADAINSAINQDYSGREILVVDDASTDNTVEVARTFKNIRVLENGVNLGIGKNIAYAMSRARGEYVVYLCADDVFTCPEVVGDIVNIFNTQKEIGVIGRYFYFFMHGKPGAIGVCRDKNILTNSCCPSGMAFRKSIVIGSNRIFIEMPSVVAQYLQDWKWSLIEYDTVAARYHPGASGNTGTKPSYYTESPTQNWIDLVGASFTDFPMFAQLKLRSPNLVWSEICLSVRTDRKVLFRPAFWLYSAMAVLLPAAVLRVLSGVYRDVVVRRFSKIIER